MGMRILHATTMGAWQAAPLQQLQLEAFVEPFGVGPVRRRIYDGTTLLRTQTVPPWTIDTSSSPRAAVSPAGYIADTPVANGTQTRIVYSVIGGPLDGTEILEVDSTVDGGGGTVDFPAGAITELCPPTVRLRVRANASLPAAPEPLAPFEVTADGIWSWFTMPEAAQIGDDIYPGSVSSDGRCRAHRVDLLTGTTKTFDLSGVLEVDDHNNASVLLLPGGRVGFFYGIHNDSEIRYRIYDGEGDFEDPSSWTAEEARGTGDGPYSYPKPFVFPNDPTIGRTWLFSRRWTSGEGTTRAISYRHSATLCSEGSDPWSAHVDVLVESGARPYCVTHQVGDTVHFAISSAHPHESTYTTVHHFRGTLVGGALVWATSPGAALTAPFGVSATTRADDGGDAKRWVSDVGVGEDGHPRILWTKYPSEGVIELWHSRWTGSAWTAHKVADDGAGLYSGEPYYHGGARFKSGDVSRIFASLPVEGVRQILELSTSDNGASWSEVRALTSGGALADPLKARPIGVINSDGRVSVMWWQGRYTSYTDYETTVQAAG